MQCVLHVAEEEQHLPRELVQGENEAVQEGKKRQIRSDEIDERRETD